MQKKRMSRTGAADFLRQLVALERGRNRRERRTLRAPVVLRDFIRKRDGDEVADAYDEEDGCEET